jgi:Family of unknown function (DUF5719)
VRNLRTSRIILGVAVILVLGGLYGLSGVKHSVALAAGQAVSPVRSVAVTSVTRACPSPGWTGGAGGGVAVMAAPAASGTGEAVVSRLAAAGSATVGPHLFNVAQPGYLQLTGVATDAGASSRSQQASGQSVATTPQRGGVVVRATGAMAQGLEVEQTVAGGLPTASCGSPGTDFWFVGPGQHRVSHIELFLMNASNQVADADVDVFTDAGPVQGTTADTGITVPAHGMVVQLLAPTVSGSRSLMLHVRTSAGQVVAAVQESTGKGPGAWLPAAQEPATHLVLPGLPGTAGSRDLYVAVPGVQDAKVSLQAVTARGSYEPTGAGGIDIPGGSADDISLPSLGGVAAALKLTSNVPVTAVAMASGGAQGAPGAFTAATPAIQEQGVVADDLNAAGRVSSLVISAPRGAAKVRVVEVAQAGSSASSVHRSTQVVAVAAGHSVVLPLTAVPGAPAGSAFSVVLTPMAGSGPVYAGRVIAGSGTGGVLQAILPVASALTSVPLATVRNSFVANGS